MSIVMPEHTEIKARGWPLSKFPSRSVLLRISGFFSYSYVSYQDPKRKIVASVAAA
jgi:hypothetical protein